MIVVCDINEIWRKKPFAALAEKTNVLGVSPADWFLARRRGRLPPAEGGMEILPVILPPSWASGMAWLGQRMLWKKIESHCEELGKTVEALVVTSPHYLPLLDLVPRNLKIFYYASDDYRSYKGWGEVVEKEKELVERVDHTFFVSAGLMERAKADYGVTNVSVSMNATEPRFFGNGKAAEPPSGELSRPIAGIVGGINDRLDFEILAQCADLPELGTLLLVGPLPENPGAGLKQLLEHQKCVAVGRQPHGTIHQWFQCVDVGLIPYVTSEFNRMCSPMRLFDQLATGAPIVATAACEQLGEFPDRVRVAPDAKDFAVALKDVLESPPNHIAPGGNTWSDRAEAMLNVMKERDIA